MFVCSTITFNHFFPLGCVYLSLQSDTIWSGILYRAGLVAIDSFNLFLIIEFF